MMNQMIKNNFQEYFMNEYELLVSEVQKKTPVIETDLFQNTGCYGLYRDGRIYIEKSLSLVEKRNVLAEELGHHDTSFGDILNQDCLENRKQELKARQYALEQLVTLDDLIKCSESGFSNHYTCAEFLGVDVETLKNVLAYYRQKFGDTHFYKGRIFEFNDLSVMILNTNLQ
ncbi:toxin [Enterococcus faecalis]|uniref:ImmA/IrrE family metallo-endopeptidase n=1 Tax=Enterococcus faecalis TaxID=1351 RepID=UPI000DE8B2F3|nr:ImmA/IrrE family metallo-endopeptidase [Enterococcus faecalis]EIR9756246.1 toxin [Enterococcus faecalis]EIW2179376.1 toxin [Enterococcus faecalis]EJG4537766.1 toxin [Enterococcus faecalis]EJH6400255.1 toxin [Enterococcus faecalis]EKR9352836.1 toxin [Enterococcus faecalis]